MLLKSSQEDLRPPLKVRLSEALEVVSNIMSACLHVSYAVLHHVFIHLYILGKAYEWQVT